MQLQANLMKYSISARLHSRSNKDNTRSILVVLYFDKEKSVYPTGITIPEDEWDTDKQLVKVSYVHSVDFSATIQAIQLQLHSLIKVVNEPVTHHKVKKYFEMESKEVGEWKGILQSKDVDASKLNTVNAESGSLADDFIQFKSIQDGNAAINNIVANAKVRRSKILDRLEKSGIYTSDDKLRKDQELFLKMQVEYVKQLTQTNSVKLGTLKQVKSLFNNLAKFQSETGYPLTFANMGFDFYQKYGDWVLVAEGNFDGFYGSLVKRLRTWLGWCVDEEGIAVNAQFRSKKFKVLTEVFDVIYLSTTELEWLDAFRNHANCKPSWIRVIDMALVQASIGCRYSDMMDSSWYFDGEMLKGYTIKNSSTYIIPVKSSKWISILKDYNMTFQLPVRHSKKVAALSDPKFNKYLKECLQAMYATHGLHMEDHEKLVKKRTKRGVPTFERKFKWEMITSHSLRRSFVSRMVRLGYKQE